MELANRPVGFDLFGPGREHADGRSRSGHPASVGFTASSSNCESNPLPERASGSRGDSTVHRSEFAPSLSEVGSPSHSLLSLFSSTAGPNAYHSTAEVSYETEDTRTRMEFVGAGSKGELVLGEFR